MLAWLGIHLMIDMLPTNQDLGVMGSNAHYRPGFLNSNVIVNELIAPVSVRAFAPTAVIIQHKKIPDVSFWQLEIDWDAMREKTDTVIIRAGQNVWEDIQFKRNWAEARKRGMLRAPYYFYDDRASPGAQAEKWHSLIKDDPPEMEAITDWENTYGGQFKGLPNVVAMMERMESYGYKSALYTGAFWFRANSNALLNSSHYAYLKQRPLHLAWYTADASQVMIPAPWSDLWMWQYGTPQEDYGQKTKEIDMNFVNMTDVNFYKRYGGVIPEPTEPPTGEPMPTLIGEVIVSELNIRPLASTNLAPIGKLKMFDQVEASNEFDGWWKITKITRVGTNVPLPGTMCFAYEGLNNGYIKDLTPAPVPTPTRRITNAIVYFDDGTSEELVPK